MMIAIDTTLAKIAPVIVSTFTMRYSSAPAAPVGHRRRLVELHVRRDGGADEGDGEEEVLLAPHAVRPQEVRRPPRGPTGLAEHRRDRVGDERQAQQEEHPLGVAVVAEHHHGPHHDRGDRHGDVARHAEDLEGGPDAGELRHHQTQVGDEQAHDGEGGGPQRELLADERHQALAGVGAEAGRHLLHDDQRHRDQQHQEEGGVAELRARPTRRWRCHRRRSRRWPRSARGRAPPTRPSTAAGAGPRTGAARARAGVRGGGLIGHRTSLR